ELLSHLHFSMREHSAPDTAGTSTATSRKPAHVATLWHVDFEDPEDETAPATTSKMVASLIRPTHEIFVEQLKFLDDYADLREDRASEILTQLGPQIAFWTSIANLHPSRTRWTLELLDTALRLANFVEMRFKHA